MPESETTERGFSSGLLKMRSPSKMCFLRSMQEVYLMLLTPPPLRQ